MTKILVVDDDLKICKAIGARLESIGCTVCSAHDGMSAVNVAIRELPDLIVLDINMPAGNGIKVAERLESLPNVATTPIVFITASKDPDLLQSALDSRPTIIIEKPFTSEELIQVIEMMLPKNSGLEA